MESLLRFPAEANLLLDAKNIPLINQKLCRQIGQDGEFMGTLFSFILKNISAHRNSKEWSDLECVAFNGQYLFKMLTIPMGKAKIKILEPEFSEDGEEIVSRQAPNDP